LAVKEPDVVDEADVFDEPELLEAPSPQADRNNENAAAAVTERRMDGRAKKRITNFLDR
jgi:hypothetical protein